MPLSDTQAGPNGLNAIPHGLTRFVSVVSAVTEPSDTRLCTTYELRPKPPPSLCAAAGSDKVSATSAGAAIEESKGLSCHVS